MFLKEVIFELDVFNLMGGDDSLFERNNIFNSPKCENTYFIQETPNCPVLLKCRSQRGYLG